MLDLMMAQTGGQCRCICHTRPAEVGYLVMRHSINFRHQFDAVLPSDQDAFQGLTVLLHLFRGHGHLFTVTSAAELIQSDSTTV